MSGSTEKSLCDAYCVVYVLKSAEWKVLGQGWALVHLYQDTEDNSHRIVGWTVLGYEVVINANVTTMCKYKKKSDDFHQFVDEEGTTFGFGFYKRESSQQDPDEFMQRVMAIIYPKQAPGLPQAPPAVSGPSIPMQQQAFSPARQQPQPPPQQQQQQQQQQQVAGGGGGPPPIPVGRSGGMGGLGGGLNGMFPPPQQQQRGPPPISYMQQQQQQHPPIPNFMEYKEVAPDPAKHAHLALGLLQINEAKPARSETANQSNVSDPYDVRHTVNVNYDKGTRSYQGLPQQWVPKLHQQFGLDIGAVEAVKVAGYDARIPNVLLQMKRYLDKEDAFSIEGVFRKSADQDECTYVKKQLNENAFEGCDDIHCITNLIKVWFRELPRALLDPISPMRIHNCQTGDDVAEIIDRLPEPNRSVFLWLADLCVAVAARQDENKMTPKNLAIVVGPNLFKPSMVDPMASLRFSQSVAAFFTQAINFRSKQLNG